MCPLGLSLLVGRKKNGGRAEIFCFMVIYCPDMVEREKRERVGGGRGKKKDYADALVTGRERM